MIELEFEALAKKDVTAHTSEEEAAWLRADDQIGRYVDFLTYLEATLAAQIEAFDLGLSKKDVEWRRSSNLFWLRVRARLAEIRPILVARDRRLDTDLRRAIVTHQHQTLTADLQPTEADKTLWSMAAAE